MFATNRGTEGPFWGPLENLAKSGPQSMALTDTAIRAFGNVYKPTKKKDERGLYLLFQPSGGKLWRFKYRFEGKEKKLGFGRYPDVSLKEARKRRDLARETLAKGIDPAEEKKQNAILAELNAAK